jgi:hypothetical protein
MCKILLVAQGWWAIVGAIVQFVGFMMLFRITVFELLQRHMTSVYGMDFDIKFKPPESPGEWQAANSVFKAMVRPGFKRLVAGAAVAFIGLLLQIVGSWPC